MPSPYRPLYPLPGDLTEMSRRTFVAGSVSFAAAALFSSRAWGATTTSLPRFAAYPFSLGIASGDPAPDGFVLWTRLAPRPLEENGGMPPESVEVRWQVATDEGMTKVVAQGSTLASAAWAHSVHVEVSGLKPDRWYWYQFKAGSETSQKGRTRTLPAARATPDRLRFVFASCQHYETGLYTSYEHMAREEPDLVFHLGDYIYEGAALSNRTRRHNSGEIVSLHDYRARYALYKQDPALQAMHSLAPWMVTWDDHEVVNNYASDIPGKADSMTRDAFLARRAAAYQAYYEHMPLRRSALPSGPDMLLYRRIAFGRLAEFHVLDTRQYRTDQPCGDGNKPPCPDALNPQATALGTTQRDWLLRGLDRSPSTWNVLAQQVMMARVDRSPGPDFAVSMDQWPGYEIERRKLLQHFRERKTRNPVVLTGDIHSNWANELVIDFDRPDSLSVATEFVGTSISSGGDGIDQPKHASQLLSENPFVKFHNAERGYVRCELNGKTWRSDYRTVPYVSRPGAPLNTRASFVVEAGRPQLQKA